MVLEHLAPRHVWDIFEHLIAATPRESKQEARIREAIKRWVSTQATRRGLSLLVREDQVGNLLIRVPASKGMENVPSLLLQAHMDMVCETDRPDGFDFANSGIPLRLQDDGWLTADGTTLGADNGIGVALALATIVDDDPTFLHGPIEILLTVDEETGLTGAFSLDKKQLDIRSRLYVNLDAEDMGLITIGSAGGGDLVLERTITPQSPTPDLVFLQLEVSGLLGGHSGVDIHLPRANANKIVARCLAALRPEIPVHLSRWDGGSKHNAIPRTSTAVFGVPSGSLRRVESILAEECRRILAYYRDESGKTGILEPNIRIEFTQVAPQMCLSADESAQIIATVNALPHGYRNFSPDVPGLVETSSNVAIVKTEKDKITVHVSVRSSIDAELLAYRHSLAEIGAVCGWTAVLGKTYPGWRPEPNNPFLKFVKQQYERVYGSQVNTRAVHAGLECSVIGSHFPGMQMVAVGPTIKNAHTPDEKLSIADVELFYSFLKTLLVSLREYRE